MKILRVAEHQHYIYSNDDVPDRLWVLSCCENSLDTEENRCTGFENTYLTSHHPIYKLLIKKNLCERKKLYLKVAVIVSSHRTAKIFGVVVKILWGVDDPH